MERKKKETRGRLMKKISCVCRRPGRRVARPKISEEATKVEADPQ